MGKAETAVQFAVRAQKQEGRGGGGRRTVKKEWTVATLESKLKTARKTEASKLRALLRKLKAQEKEKRYRDKKELRKQGVDVPRGFTRTTDNQRRPDDALHAAQDAEIVDFDQVDEFAKYFSGERTPKLMITTQERPNKTALSLVQELQICIPNMYYYIRGKYRIKSICKYAANNDFTDLLVVTQHQREVRGLIVIHLPEGPTAFYRLRSLKLAQELKGGAVTDHKPEVIFRDFLTALGRRAGRSLAALFPQDPEFMGRRVISFINRRDYIFFRHHRYIFDDEGRRCRLQEIGPRFSLKLHWLHQGTFAPQTGNYEFFWKPEYGVDRKQMAM